MKTQNIVGIVTALSILIAAVLIVSSTIAFQNAHALTVIATATSGSATAMATASTASDTSTSATAGTCSAFASILSIAIAGC